MIDQFDIDQVQIVRMENSSLRVNIAPGIGGRVVSLFNKVLEREFLWINRRVALRPSQPGDTYDPVFYGGIDEVIPGDFPERIGGLDCPDHGELWTLPLEARIDQESLVLSGYLPRWGLAYEKRITLGGGLRSPWMDVDYRIVNQTNERRIFLWKLHAAVKIQAGDWLDCPAKTAVVADPQWSRWNQTDPFAWPWVNGERADRIPPADGTTDFLFLYDLSDGRMGLRSPANGCEFTIVFDRQTFPYACTFASYGGLDGHYTAVLEPCTAMPVSVNKAALLNQCSILEAGEVLTTRVSIYAGPLN